ncbi:hypothetical protein PENFLA_c014G01445 [Penicillium flavigenum]|uniref:5'-3' DNA helicase ZGRF1-like N-terminal domain-containing protein n=1 Tax=Penicillium flavigenum TaxID=254877 RepID=A0A1V6T588_9EURO|nr:hypothetical protein PENFLA_c014G01445 [Penicillium flavigenum]
MMSTPSSSTRLPPTSPQVTASVVKFRCLYTHDLRRKSKRWHDGYLRFHKFNKRVMVYDDQGNFIGDHHWRSPDDVQDGDEMELDKGVLIEVTENMGTTETDITTLYEKKKSSQGSPQAREPVSQVPRSSTSASASAPLRSSQSFRSLNDLLGIKRTPIGHLVSPYEQRNPPRPASSIQEPERAPKRQRTSSVVNRSQGEVIDLTDLTGSPQGPSTKQRSNQVTKEPPRAGGDSAADVPLTNCEQRSTLQSTQVRPQRPNPSSFSRASNSATSEPTFSLPTPEVVRTANNSVQPARPLANKSKNGPLHIQPPKPSVPSSTDSLPAVTPETEIPRPRGDLRVEHPSIHRENQSRAVSRPIPPQKSDPPTRTTGGSTPQAPVRTVTNYVKPIEPADNQASINVPPSANVPPSTDMPPPSRPSSALGSGASTAALRMGTAKPRRKLMYSALLPGASRTPSPASDTPPGSATRGTVTNTPEQQLAAATDNSTNEEFVPSTSTQFIFDEMIDGSGFKSPSTTKRLTGKRSFDSPLRKSISDPTALTTPQVPAGGSLDAANKENELKEQGPWTSEALDLFDFWPAGRPKPSE